MTDKHKVFTVRRLFRCDSEIVGRCYEEFDFLHFNPVGKSRIESIFAQGQIWGAFDGDKIIACSYMLRADAPFFTQLDAYWEISDLLDDSLEDFLVAGYVWIDSEYRDYPVYAAMSKLWNITAMKKGLGKVLHCVPAHIYFSMGELFESGFLLCGLRGLDKLVPHYIFVKETGLEKTEYAITDVKSCLLSDTKEISRLCEKGYRGFYTDGKQKIDFTYRR